VPFSGSSGRRDRLGATVRPVPTVRTPPRTRSTPDLVAVLVAALVVVAAAVVGRALRAAGVDIFLPFPPLRAEWLPHAGPGTPVAVAVAVLVVARGPQLALRLRWPAMVGLGYLTGWSPSAALCARGRRQRAPHPRRRRR